MTQHDVPVNEEHFQQWVEVMATTDKKQGDGYLRVRDAGETEFRYCCLGLGAELVPGIQVEVRDSDDKQRDTGMTYFDDEETLAPKAFVEWLGLPTDDDGTNGWDIEFDFPLDLLDRDDKPMTCSDYSAAALNDNGFTFKQIADIARYFGIREARH